MLRNIYALDTNFNKYAKSQNYYQICLKRILFPGNLSFMLQICIEMRFVADSKGAIRMRKVHDKTQIVFLYILLNQVVFIIIIII